VAIESVCLPDRVDNFCDLRDGHVGHDLERGSPSEPAFDGIEVLEDLRELGRVLPVGIVGPGDDPLR
jgi:hypothetical protein